MVGDLLYISSPPLSSLLPCVLFLVPPPPPPFFYSPFPCSLYFLYVSPTFPFPFSHLRFVFFSSVAPLTSSLCSVFLISLSLSLSLYLYIYLSIYLSIYLMLLHSPVVSYLRYCLSPLSLSPPPSCPVRSSPVSKLRRKTLRGVNI